MRGRSILPVLALGCGTAMALESHVNRGTQECLAHVEKVRGKFDDLVEEVLGASSMQSAPVKLRRSFHYQSENAMKAAWSLCETVSSGVSLHCSGQECSTVEASFRQPAPWMLSGVPLYAAVDQDYTEAGECSIFGSRMDALNRVPQAKAVEPWAGYAVALRERSSRAAVEACLTLYKGKEALCEEEKVGRREMLNCK